jgi:hypothetical protein
MGMSQSYGLNPGDCDDMIAVLRGAVEHGVAFFDTAEVYGPPSTKNSSGKADILGDGGPKQKAEILFYLPKEAFKRHLIDDLWQVKPRPLPNRLVPSLRCGKGSVQRTRSCSSQMAVPLASLTPVNGGTEWLLVDSLSASSRLGCWVITAI